MRRPKTILVLAVFISICLCWPVKAGDFQVGQIKFFREGNTGYLKFDVSLPEGFNHYAQELHALPLDSKISHLIVSYPPAPGEVSRAAPYSPEMWAVPPELKMEDEELNKVYEQWEKKRKAFDFEAKQRGIIALEKMLEEVGEAEEKELAEKIVARSRESLARLSREMIALGEAVLDAGDRWLEKFENLNSPREGLKRADQISRRQNWPVLAPMIDMVQALKKRPGITDEEKGRLKEELKSLQARDTKITERRREISSKYWEAKREFERKRRQAELRAITEAVARYDRATVIGRFRGRGAAKLKLVTLPRGETSIMAGTVAEVNIKLPDEEGGPEGMKACWQKAFVSRYKEIWLQGSDPLFCYLGVKAPEMRGGPDASLYAMVSGALALQETLQLWVTQQTDTGERTIPVEGLSPPELKVHDFEQLRGGKKSFHSDVANLIPADFLYLHFSSSEKAAEFGEALTELMQGFLQGRGITGRDYDLVPRMLAQVGLALPDFLETERQNLVGEVAVGLSDSLVRDGTGFVLAMKVKNRIAYRLLEKTSLAALAFGKRSERGKTTYMGKEYSWTVSRDGKLRSFRADIEGYRVLANSEDTIKRVIRTSKTKESSLAGAEDFLYMRSIFPGKSDEDGFMYLSDAFVGKLLSPQWRIANARRKVCAGKQILLRTLVEMHTLEHKELPEGLQELRSKYEGEVSGILVCPEGGDYILEDGIPGCSVHGRLGMLKSVDELFPSRVSKKEKESFEEFVTGYTRIWRRYLDPIGISLRIGRDGIQARTCILPLVENSAYQTISQLLGGQATAFNTNYRSPTTVAAIQTRLRPQVLHEFYEPWDRGDYKSFFSRLTPGEARLEWVGDSATLAFHDSQLLFSYDFSALQGEMFGDAPFLIAGGLLTAAINMPVSLHLNIKDSQMASNFVEKLIDFTKEKLFVDSLKHRGERWIRVSSYSTKIHGNDVSALDVLLYVVKFRLFWTVLNDQLVIATRPEVLGGIIEAQRSSKFSPEGNQGHIAMRIHGKAFNRLSRDYDMNWQEKIRESCMANLARAQALFYTGTAKPESLDEVTKMAYGYRLVCPAGGSYRWDTLRSETFCSVHGYAGKPRQSIDVLAPGPAARFVEHWKELKCFLRFTPEGIMTEINLGAPRATEEPGKNKRREKHQ